LACRRYAERWQRVFSAEETVDSNGNSLALSQVRRYRFPQSIRTIRRAEQRVSRLDAGYSVMIVKKILQ